jgi:hypothetical protein
MGQVLAIDGLDLIAIAIEQPFEKSLSSARFLDQIPERIC